MSLGAGDVALLGGGGCGIVGEAGVEGIGEPINRFARALRFVYLVFFCSIHMDIVNFYSLYFFMRAVGRVSRHAGLMCRLGVVVSVGIIGLWIQACGINMSLI